MTQQGTGDLPLVAKVGGVIGETETAPSFVYDAKTETVRCPLLETVASAWMTRTIRTKAHLDTTGDESSDR